MFSKNDIVIASEMVGIEVPRVNADGKFKVLKWNGDMAHGTFERYDTRFELSLTKLIDSDNYVCAVSNFYFCISTPRPWNIAYKASEKDIPLVDSESIEIAMRYMHKMIIESQENKI